MYCFLLSGYYLLKKKKDKDQTTVSRCFRKITEPLKKTDYLWGISKDFFVFWWDPTGSGLNVEGKAGESKHWETRTLLVLVFYGIFSHVMMCEIYLKFTVTPLQSWCTTNICKKKNNKFLTLFLFQVSGRVDLVTRWQKGEWFTPLKLWSTLCQKISPKNLLCRVRVFFCNWSF